MHPVPAGPVAPVDQGPAVLARAGRAVPAVVTVPVARADRVARVGLGLAVRVDPVGRVGLGLVDLVAPAVVTGLAGLVSPEDRERVRTVPAAQVSLAGPVAQADRVDLEGLAGPVRRAVPVGLAGTDLADPEGLAAHRRLRMCSVATTTGVVRSGVVPATHRTASVRRTTVRRHRRFHTDSGGTVDLLPERRHPTGTDRRPRAAGTDRRLQGAGTHDGMGRRAT